MEIINTFQFKKFAISQTNSVFKIGTDACLLGSFINQNLNNSIKEFLEVGIGTGVISQMILSEHQSLKATGIDINIEAVELSDHNAKNNGFSKRFKAFHTSYNELSYSNQYDFICCNPPYFISSLKNEEINKTKARHQDNNFEWESFAAKCNQFLKTNGSVYMVFPADQFQNVHNIFSNKDFVLSNLVWVKGTAKRPITRCLVKFSLSKVKWFKEETLCIELARHQYTKKAINWLSPYYLKL